jgi:dTDP-4-dehydrorhamnose reductase
MRILITGRHGQLAKSIKSLIINTALDIEFYFSNKKELDLNCDSSIDDFFNNNNYDIIVNCAAYTSVEMAESEESLANQINHLAVRKLAEVAHKQNAKIIHISTDYVFSGNTTTPYIESDSTLPINTYGKTKLAGEKIILKLLPNNAIIIRSSWLYSEYGNNFIKTMLKLGKEKESINIVCDQIGSPTYAGDLASVIINIAINKDLMGMNFATQIYHYSNLGQCSWHEFAKEIFKISDIKCNVRPVTSEQYTTKAKRPIFSVLNSEKIINTFDIKIPRWEASLKKCIDGLK